ncbi:hypothetical protein D3C87_2208480 [compost metagenome]
MWIVGVGHGAKRHCKQVIFDMPIEAGIQSISNPLDEIAHVDQRLFKNPFDTD